MCAVSLEPSIARAACNLLTHFWDIYLSADLCVDGMPGPRPLQYGGETTIHQFEELCSLPRLFQHL